MTTEHKKRRFPCPRCGASGRVAVSQFRDQAVYRRYVCENRHRWSTHEMPVDEARAVKLDAERAKHLAVLERLVLLVPKEFA